MVVLREDPSHGGIVGRLPAKQRREQFPLVATGIRGPIENRVEMVPNLLEDDSAEKLWLAPQQICPDKNRGAAR